MLFFILSGAWKIIREKKRKEGINNNKGENIINEERLPPLVKW